MINNLGWKSISEAADEAIQEIEGRRDGTIKSLKTSKPKLDNALFDGVPWGSIMLTGGLSGSGKSMFVEELKRDFVDCNPDQDFEILSFEFEMLGKMQVLRNLSGKTGKSVKDLLSAGGTKLSSADLTDVTRKAMEVGRYPISYVDNTGTHEEIEDTITHFINEKELIENNRGLVITMDHVLLAKEKPNESERIMLKNICNAMIRVKKRFSSKINILIILVTQLNRDIEQKERILNKNLHMPTKTDIMGSSSLFQACDYCVILHCPANISGIGNAYSHMDLPLFHPGIPEKKMIYFHVLKTRTDNSSILMMYENFAESKIEEYNDLSDFKV